MKLFSLGNTAVVEVSDWYIGIIVIGLMVGIASYSLIESMRAPIVAKVVLFIILYVPLAGAIYSILPYYVVGNITLGG